MTSFISSMLFVIILAPETEQTCVDKNGIIFRTGLIPAWNVCTFCLDMSIDNAFDQYLIR